MPATTTPPSLSPELWCLLGFAMWGLLLVVALAAWRVALVLRGRKRARIEFPNPGPAAA